MAKFKVSSFFFLLQIVITFLYLILAGAAATVRVDPAYQYQSMFGFGGAFTDSAGLNIATLSAESQETLIRSYFAPEGIRYDLCRIPIAGSDFSVRPYSYDDVEGDVDLEFFALAEEDYNYKVCIFKGDNVQLNLAS